MQLLKSVAEITLMGFQVLCKWSEHGQGNARTSKHRNSCPRILLYGINKRNSRKKRNIHPRRIHYALKCGHCLGQHGKWIGCKLRTHCGSRWNFESCVYLFHQGLTFFAKMRIKFLQQVSELSLTPLSFHLCAKRAQPSSEVHIQTIPKHIWCSCFGSSRQDTLGNNSIIRHATASLGPRAGHSWQLC